VKIRLKLALWLKFLLFSDVLICTGISLRLGANQVEIVQMSSYYQSLGLTFAVISIAGFCSYMYWREKRERGFLPLFIFLSCGTTFVYSTYIFVIILSSGFTTGVTTYFICLLCSWAKAFGLLDLQVNWAKWVLWASRPNDEDE
jgi:NADH:ubiquinone oxidoreductase subunit 2 (subunit N)